VAREIADDVLLLPGRLTDPNSYVIGGVLVDSCPRWARRRLLRDLRGIRLEGHVLSHVHPPVQGASRAVAEEFGVDVYCGAQDLRALTTGDFRYTLPVRRLNRVLTPVLRGPVVSDAKPLWEGDEIGGFRVIEAPGHSPGHLAFWREHDRVLIVGDVVTNRGLWDMRKGLKEPPPVLTLDPRQNRASARKLAALEPRVVCFAHGEPLRDADLFMEWVARHPD
jgi:glyoxylase-like metal-dependent hydrolase (beta-lactamase superfamily II)